VLGPIRLSLKSSTKYFTYFPEEEISSVKIGRSLRCEFSVPLEDLSREHCLFEIIDGEYFLTDLKSSNGVWVNQVRIGPDKKTKVTPSSLIVLANIYTLTINPTEIISKSETATTKNVDREIDTVSFQLDYPVDKKKKIKKAPEIVAEEAVEKKPSVSREMVIMFLGFLGICIYLLYEFASGN
jgi:pSer/pThr/pTyr-binding forkhead associated (FHA) protein